MLDPDSISRWAGAVTPDQRARLDELHFIGSEVLRARDDRERLRRWHELLFAVGNMKRSAGNIHPPNTWLNPDVETGPRPSTVPLPPGVSEDGDPALLAVDDPSTWPKLTWVRGLGPATASMVLASLWPDQHATFDRLTRLVIGAVFWPDEPVSANPPPVSMSAYADWYRPYMLELSGQAGLPMWMVERGIFRFAQLSLGGRSPVVLWDDTRGWEGYGEDVAAAFRSS